MKINNKDNFSNVVIVDRKTLMDNPICFTMQLTNLIVLDSTEFIYVKEHDFYINKKYYLTYLGYIKYNRLSHFIEFSKEIHNVDTKKIKEYC